ncbi:MAG: SGNH/GDSL hydrolase family protein [Clostridia bacterium]|nr:SGNH/GDSL hydrolase family protein [Clostridia bacterium]
MHFIQQLRNATYPNTGAPVIAFLGDSVTHGAFELVDHGSYNCNFDHDAVYHARLRRMLLEVNPWLPVNIINAGVAGDNAPMGLARVERDVIAHKPDICVVNFCLNDLAEPVEEYIAAMRSIFEKLLAAGIRPILLTPSMLNTYVHPDLHPMYHEYAAQTAEWHKNGYMDAYVNAARAMAKEMGIPVADAYARWQAMEAAGADMTACLSNYINHPTREMHTLFAEALFEVLDSDI